MSDRPANIPESMAIRLPEFPKMTDIIEMLIKGGSPAYAFFPTDDGKQLRLFIRKDILAEFPYRGEARTFKDESETYMMLLLGFDGEVERLRNFIDHTLYEHLKGLHGAR
jgi:hypothetical protein